MSKNLPRSGEISNIGYQKYMENHYFHHKIAQKASTKLKKSPPAQLKTMVINFLIQLQNRREAAIFFGNPPFFLIQNLY